MNVSANLLEYLKKNDSAELIGIGTFRVSYTHASMSPITNTLTPPSRSITFVNELNDDLSFIQSMAKNEFISVDTAIKWVKQYSDSVKERIELSNTCKLGDLGTLSKGIGKGYAFTPQEGLNLLDSAFAFSTLKSVKTFDQGDFIKPIITKEPIVDEPIIEHKIEEPIQKVVIGTSLNVDIKSDELKNSDKNKEEVFEKEENKDVDNSLNIEQTESKDIIFEEREAVERDPSQFDQAQKEVEERLKKNEVEDNDEVKDEFDYTNSKRFRKKAKKIEKKRKKEIKAKRKRNKILWKVLFTIVILALLACGALVFSHYMCWLKENKTLEPITLRLNNFITPKCDRVAEKTIIIPVATQTVQVVETSTVEIETPTTEAVVPEVAVTAEQKEKQKIIERKRKIAKEKAKKEADKLKPTGEKDNPPAPTSEIDYTTPITMQSVSRLGFDVVGGTFGDKSNAQQASRKARSMGYDSYIISKIKNDKPIYYVSYGSRRSMKEASDFMKKISKRSGGSEFYIISR